MITCFGQERSKVMLHLFLASDSGDFACLCSLVSCKHHVNKTRLASWEMRGQMEQSQSSDSSKLRPATCDRAHINTVEPNLNRPSN